MDSIASRVKSRRAAYRLSKGEISVTTENANVIETLERLLTSYPQPHTSQQAPSKRHVRDSDYIAYLEDTIKKQGERIRGLRLTNMAKNMAMERIAKAHQAAEKEAADLRKKMRGYTFWEPHHLREFNEVRFSDGLRRFVNARGDCVNSKGEYIGHFWWHTERVCCSTPPADWEDLVAGGDFLLNEFKQNGADILKAAK